MAQLYEQVCATCLFSIRESTWGLSRN